MKKIFLSVLAVAALASCTKMDTAYETPQEIGFRAVAGNLTKAPVDGVQYPTTLNMYVFAQTTDNTNTNANYINNGEFTYINRYDAIDNSTTVVDATNVWGGGSSSSSRNPYYWPNEKKLHFSGYSKSGNVKNISTGISYDCIYDKLTILNYTPGNLTDDGVNDLMWFQSTKYSQNEGFGKSTTYVPVNMYHTCAWITFMVKGDEVTGNSASSYKITGLTMNGVDQTADVTCTGNKDLSVNNLSTYVVWSENTTQTGDNTTYTVTIPSSGVALSGTYTTTTNEGTTTITETPKNIETNAETTIGGNIVVIPQKPGTIDIAWTYASSTTATISDSATGLSLKLNKDNTLNWEPGKHYIYTITIKANEILIAPTPVEWDEDSHTVTVE